MTDQRIVQGALYAPGDRSDQWQWVVPLMHGEDSPSGEWPDEDAASLRVYGRTFSDVIANGTAMLKMLGFRGEALLCSECWRFDYASISISDALPNGAMTCMPDQLCMLEQMGPVE
jgi:hypothetical protein